MQAHARWSRATEDLTFYNTMQWLIWLAKQMQQHHLSEFQLVQLQPDWLSTKRVQRLYVWLVGVFLGLFIGVLLRLVIGLSFGLFVGALLGLVVGLIFGLFVGLLLGLIFVRWFNSGIDPTANLHWSINNIWYFRGIVLYGILVGMLFIGLYSILAIGLAFGLYIGVYCVLLFGLSVSPIDIDMHKKPDQEITNSGKNALRMGLIFGLLSELFLGLTLGMDGKLLSGLILGLIIGLYTGLIYGGAFFLNHYLIRLLLYQSGVMPLNYVRFLDEATSRYLLLPIGNGYRFNHQLFQE